MIISPNFAGILKIIALLILKKMYCSYCYFSVELSAFVWLLGKVSWKTTTKLGSDHFPNNDNLRRWDEVNDKPKFKWRLSEADLESYAIEIEKNLQKNPDNLDNDRLEKRSESQFSNLQRSILIRIRSTKELNLAWLQTLKMPEMSWGRPLDRTEMNGSACESISENITATT